MSIMLLVSFMPMGSAALAEADDNDLPVINLTLWDSTTDNFNSEEAIKNDIVGDYIFDKFKIHVSQAVGNEGVSADERFQLNVAADEMSDIVLLYGSKTAIKEQMLEGDLAWAITPEIMETYMPNLYGFYSDFVKTQYAYDAEPYNGAYTAIFSILTWDALEKKYPEQAELQATIINPTISGSRRAISVREDIFEQVRPDAYTTEELQALLDANGSLTQEELSKGGVYINSIDEFYDLLSDIQALGTDITPCLFYSTGEVQWTIARLEGGEFDANYNWNKEEFYIPIYEESVVDGYRKINAMFRNGLIPVDQYIQPEEINGERILSGDVAVTGTYPTTAMLNAAAEERGEDYRYRQIFTNFGETDFYKGSQQTVLPNSVNVIVTKTGAVKDEETLYRVLEWLDYFASDEYLRIAEWGPEDAGLYTVDENGNFRFTSEAMEQEALYGITPEDEQDSGAYYGLDWASLRGWYSSRIPVAIQDWNPYHPKYEYYPYPADSSDLWGYADQIAKNLDGFSGYYWSVEQYPMNYSPEIQELKATYPNAGDIENATWNMRNEIFPKLVTAETDEDFDKVVAEIKAEYDRLGALDYYAEKSDLLLQWYADNGYPTPATYEPWGTGSVEDAKAAMGK